MPPEIAEEDIPRTNTPDMNGADLTVKYDLAVEPGAIVVSDGTRFAVYVPLDGETVDVASPDLAIMPAYTQAGRFREAHVVTLTDGVRLAKYMPKRKL